MGKGRESLSQKQNTIKRSEGIAQMVEHLPSVCEALCSIPSVNEKEEKKEGGREGGRKEGREIHFRLWMK
jgi:hypothetical protein